jgi:O-antigen ligase
MMIAAGLAAMVFAFTCGSSSVAVAIRFGATGRWVVLVMVGAAALVGAYQRLRRSGPPRGFVGFAAVPAAYLLLAILSATWSPRPRLSFERAASLGILLGSAAALALMTAGEPRSTRRLFAGLASGATVVGLLGVILGLAGSDSIAQPRGPLTPWRYRGFGENPNTIAILSAVALPLVVWLGLTSHRRWASVWWALSFVTLLGTTVASESRGGLGGVFVGVTIVLALAVERWPRKVAAITVFTAIVVAGVGLRQAVQVAPPPFVSAVEPGTKTQHATKGPVTNSKRVRPFPGVVRLPERTAEIGDQHLSTKGTTTAGSGRFAAWGGALHLVRERPLLGYGFGMEPVVFVDRWYYFNGGRTENSVIGTLLELGIVGLLLLIGTLVSVLSRGVKCVRSGARQARGPAIAGLGVVGAGVAIAFVQSYLYSVGNVATATVWITVFVVAVCDARSVEEEKLGG